MTREELKEEIMQVLTNLSDSDAIAVNNAMCEKEHDPDSRIYFIDEFDELEHRTSPTEILSIAIDGGFTSYTEFFKYTIWGYEFLEGFDLEDSDFDLDTIAEYIIDSGDTFEVEDLEDLANLIEAYNEQDEEEEEA